MPPRTIKLLHVEDDLMQHRVMAHHLASLPEFTFSITTADNEDDAVAEFQRLRPELVILDYHLAEGNGLSCLRKLREQDRIVPIVAISGKATPEIAAELLQVGADDYLSKQELTVESLARSVRAGLVRADAWRRRVPAETAVQTPAPCSELFDELCRWFAAHNGPELVQRLDTFETAARQAKLTEGQMQDLFQAACAGPNRMASCDEAGQQRMLRPLLLEVLLRLFGEDSNAPAR